MQFLSSFLEVTKTADSWRKMVTSAKHRRYVNNKDFLLKDMYSRYKGCVKRILCCGDGVVLSICEQLQTFPSLITYKHIFRGYLGPSLNNMYTNDTIWKRNFWPNLKNVINMIFLCRNPPMESLLETFLNCQVNLPPEDDVRLIRLMQLFHVTIILRTWKNKFSVHWGINPSFFFANTSPPPTLTSENCPSPLPFQAILPPTHWFFAKLAPYKSDFSVNSHNIKTFHP